MQINKRKNNQTKKNVGFIAVAVIDTYVNDKKQLIRKSGARDAREGLTTNAHEMFEDLSERACEARERPT